MQATISEDGKSLIINFNEEYDVPEEINTLRVIKKRSYNKMLPEIAEVINILFENNEEAVEKYTEIRMSLHEKSYTELKEFLKDLKSLVECVKEDTVDYIDSVYIDKEQTVDPEDGRKKNNIELQFTVEHNKIIIRSSFMIKFIIPLIMEYLEQYHAEDKNNDKTILDCYSVCFDVNEVDGVDIKSKLFKIVSSRIKTTRYSDRPIWMLLSNMSCTPDVASNEFYRRVLLDIIPKLVHDKNVISFIHVSLKQMIQFKFRFNYPISYIPKSLVEVVDPNNDKITNLERLEFNIARVDESKAYLNRAKMYDAIINCFTDKKIDPITKGELKYYSDNVVLNNVQMNFLFLFLCRQLERYSIAYQLTFTEYMTCLIYFKKWLKTNGFPFLSKWITASFKDGSIIDEKKVVNNKDFMNSLTESKDFIYLISDKYKFVRYSLSNNNVLAKKISTILINKAEFLPSYEEYQAGEVEPEIVEDFTPTDKEKIADEVLKFIKMI